MLRRFGDIFRRASSAKSVTPRIPEGQRVYAIGDIHGRLDLFRQLIALIEADDDARASAETTIILLGDLIDRGPDSAGVLAEARAWSKRRTLRALIGNHEEMFLDAVADPDVLRHFLKVGGRETVLSYPIDMDAYRQATLDELGELLRKAVPAEDLAFLQAMEDHVQIGDYLFVHAGIKPGVALEEQNSRDLRWIREPFLSHPGPHGFCVIHGHTIREEVEVKPSPRNPQRIGIDTGAYASGRLTAIGLQGSERWFMEASL